MARKISISNQKGGVGKTTTAIELAATLTDMDRKVLVVDFDQQANLSRYTITEETGDNEFSIYNVLRAECSAKEAVIHGPYYDLIKCTGQMSKADREFIDTDAVYYLSDVLEGVDSDYDYIIIDTNPGRNIMLQMAYAASDDIVLVTECDDGSIDGLRMIIRDVSALSSGKHPITKAKIKGIVFNKVESTNMHEVAPDKIKAIINEPEFNLGDDVFLLTVRKSIKLSECKELRKPLQAHKHFSDAARDFRMIAHAFEGKE